MKDKILKLLGNGITSEVVARTVGCDPSYIAQLMADEDFAMQVAAMRCQNLEAATSRDSKYDAIEDQLQQKLEDLLPLMMKPRDILDALTRVNAAKRRGANPLTNTDIQGKQTIINLQLPAITLQHFSINSDGEVIEVGKRALVNVPAQALMKSLENRRALDDQSSKLEKPKSDLPRISSKQAARAVINEESV